MSLPKIAHLLVSPSAADAIPHDAAAVIAFPPALHGQRAPKEGFFTTGYDSHGGSLAAACPDSDVAWVRKREGGVFTRLIGLGRTQNNDIVLPYDDVSKYHAYFTTDARGAFSIADAGSTNGTFVNGQRLAAKQPLALNSGDTIAFAAHSGLFLKRDEFVFLVDAMRGQAGRLRTGS